jgi:TatD DNase family protein
LIDSHVHLHRDDFAADRAAVLDRAEVAGVTGLLNVGYDLASSEASLTLAQQDARILATAGIHPHDAVQVADASGKITPAGQRILDQLRELCAEPRVVAVGEIGLDYYRDLSPRPAQRAALRAQLTLAHEVDLPVVFHIRDAYAEIRELVDEVGVPPAGAVLHAFAGDHETVAWAQRHRLLLGIGGPVTYKNSRLPEVLKCLSADELLLETDAPWLPPVPYRGRRNEPSYLTHTLAALAVILEVAPADLERRTDANFTRLFRTEFAS